MENVLSPPSQKVLSVSAEVLQEKPRQAPALISATGAALGTTLNQMQEWEQLVGTYNWAVAQVTLTVTADFDVAVLQRLLTDHYPAVVFAVEEGAPLDAATDWVLEVQRGWAPQVIGNLTVYLPWHNAQHDRPTSGTAVCADEEHDHQEKNKNKGGGGRMVLNIEGGAAFGTGDHATTQLCGEWLQREVQRAQIMLPESTGEENNNISVLDYGCGSAILAL